MSYLGLIYQDKGDADQALKYLKEALAISKHHGFKLLEDIFSQSMEELKTDASKQSE